MAATNNDSASAIISESECDSDGGYITPTKEGPPKHKKANLAKKKRTQKYRKEWTSKPEFSPYLKPDADSNKAKCVLCNVSFLAQIHVIKNHMAGKKHLDKTKDARPMAKSVATMLKKPEVETNIKAVKRAEMKLCSYLVEHNIAFLSCDHLSDVIKSSFPDSKIAQQIRLRRTKATSLTTNVIGASHKTDLANILKQTKFSVMIDESTDISATKTTAIVVRFYDKGTVLSQFWQLIQIFNEKEPGKATAEIIFNSVIKTFTDENISLENIIGFGSDGCNTMMGSQNSVSSRFKSCCPGIFVMTCICHSLALCASEACKQLPRRCEDLARNIYNFLKNSSKRLAELKQFQEILGLGIHKILHPSQTRWLSLIAVVNRILEQWEALKFFFSNMWNREKLVAAEEIYKSLFDPSIKLYFLFLQWVLPKFTGLNEYFQSSKVVLTTLHEKVLATYKELVMSFINRNSVQSIDLNALDIKNSSNYLPLNQLYLGVNVINELNKLRSRPDFKSIESDFVSRCREFLKEGCQQIKNRYNFNDPILSRASMISPEAVLSGLYPSIVTLAQHLPRIVKQENMQKLDDQYRCISIHSFNDEIKNEKQVDKFWSKVSLLEDETGYKPFGIVSDFALGVLSLPHSNADCERVFSKINMTKTKPRNKLSASTVDGTLLSSQCVQGMGGCCKFEPTDDMYKRFSSEMYISINEPSTETSIQTKDVDILT